MKKLLLLLVVILLTGCNVNYNLEFTDEQLIENINLSIPNHEQKNIDYLKSINAYAIYDGMGKINYNSIFDEGKDNFNAKYDYTYQLNNIGRAYYINQCFENISFSKHDNQYILLTSKGFKCMLFEYHKINNLTVSITTNHKVLQHNADVVEGGIYTWEITDENADNVYINMIFGEVKKRTFWDEILDNIVPISILGGIILVVGTVVLVIAIKAKKNNEI